MACSVQLTHLWPVTHGTDLTPLCLCHFNLTSVFLSACLWKEKKYGKPIFVSINARVFVWCSRNWLWWAHWYNWWRQIYGQLEPPWLGCPHLSPPCCEIGLIYLALIHYQSLNTTNCKCLVTGISLYLIWKKQILLNLAYSLTLASSKICSGLWQVRWGLRRGFLVVQLGWLFFTVH